ncbi:hypothetical protein F4781DRAFT_427424 [Annulohypoxylon bovei var. microspora]|nr:hypothetical protein F4781DRAFT_427424 [Annulohypoxylon bovei var. microspora]
MAPPSKPSASSKGTNPAPDFTVNMNRIQTQLEARMKAFLLARPDLNHSASNPASTTGSFSVLRSQPTFQSQSQSQAAAAARRAAAEAEFAEDRGTDPNAGIGLVRASAGNSEDRDTARLRGRLLGRRGKNGEGPERRWVRKEESSDEEAGRSGLGRAKGNGRGKRSRAEMEDRDRVEEEAVSPEIKAPAVEDGNGNGNISEQANPTASAESNVENLASKRTLEAKSTVFVDEGNSKKRRKRKNKKLKKKIDEA